MCPQTLSFTDHPLDTSPRTFPKACSIQQTMLEMVPLRSDASPWQLGVRQRRIKIAAQLSMTVIRPIGYWSALDRCLPLSYGPVARLQESLVSRKKHGELSCDVMLLLEHAPVYTVGRRMKDAAGMIGNVRVERAMRGGLATFHGPGQLVVYPILDLRDWKPDLRWYVRALQEAMIQATAKLGVVEKATTEDQWATSGDEAGMVGVWMGNGQRKIGSIGFRVDRWIVSHGLAYNVTVDLEMFKNIVPCGLTDKEITSVQKEQPNLAPATLKLSNVASVFIPCLENTFGRPIVPLQNIDLALYKELDEWATSHILV